MYPTKKLWEICDLYQPKTISIKDMIEDWEYPVFWANWIIWKYNQYNHENEEILITCRWATCWTINISEKFSWINGNAMVSHIKDEKELNFYYLYYFFKNTDFSKIISGSAQPQITRQWLVAIPIPLPPLSTQQKIISKLDSLFEKLDQAITLTKQNLANIEELNKSVLEKIFKECEEKYEKRKLGEVCNKITDWSHNPPKWIETWYPMISARNLTDFNEIIFDNLRFLSENDYLLENKRTDVKDWDILLSIVWTIWKICIVKEEYWKFVMQRSLAVFKLNKNFLHSKFTYFYFKSDFIQKLLNNSAIWATQKWIYLKDLKQISIPLPPLSEQQKIVEYLDNIFAKNKTLQDKCKQDLQNLEELKQSILKQAFENEDFIK